MLQVNFDENENKIKRNGKDNMEFILLQSVKGRIFCTGIKNWKMQLWKQELTGDQWQA